MGLMHTLNIVILPVVMVNDLFRNQVRSSSILDMGTSGHEDIDYGVSVAGFPDGC